MINVYRDDDIQPEGCRMCMRTGRRDVCERVVHVQDKDINNARAMLEGAMKHMERLIKQVGDACVLSHELLIFVVCSQTADTCCTWLYSCAFSSGGSTGWRSTSDPGRLFARRAPTENPQKQRRSSLR